MNSKLVVAALIAATLALGACSKDPQPHARAAIDNTTPPIPVAGASPATRGLINETARTVANGVNVTGSFMVPMMVKEVATGFGVTTAFAFFHADHAGDLKVTATTGVPAVEVGYPEKNLAGGFDPAKGIPVQAGWHRVDIECLSDTCTNVTATFNGQPIVPYAWPYSVVAGGMNVIQ